MTVFDRIQSMTKDELQHLIHYIYLWGHINEQCGVDDECFYEHLLDLPERHVHNIINAMDNLQLYNIRIHSFDGEPPVYMNTKFFDIHDAGHYLTKTFKHITKIDDTTYTTTKNVYRIIPHNGTL